MAKAKTDEELYEAMMELRTSVIPLLQKAPTQTVLDTLRHLLLEIVMGLSTEADKAVFLDSFVTSLFDDVKANIEIQNGGSNELNPSET